MTSDSSRWLAVPVLFSSVDILAQILCLSFYHEGLYFDANTLEEKLFFTKGFNALSSGIEFVLLGNSFFLM